MATYPAELRYTREHEWAKVEGKRARVGITHYAQDQLGDVVFVELPKVGAKVTPDADLRRRRVRQGRVGPVRAALRRGGRGEPGAHRSSPSG